MNWERKFSSIVQETEANLAKVKEKLRGKSNRSVTFDYSPIEEHSFTSQMKSSTPKTHLMNRDHHGSPTSLNTFSQPSMLQLQEKIHKQNMTIEQLQQVVQGMEKERKEHQEQIRRLKNEVNKLSCQMLEQGSSISPHLEWQMNQMKRNLIQEVQDLRDQLHQFRLRAEKHTAAESTSLSLSRDIHDVRQDIQEQLSFIRRDLGALNKRLGSLERDSDLTASKSDRVLDYDRKKTYPTSYNGRTQYLTDVLRTCPDADRIVTRNIDHSLGAAVKQPLDSTVDLGQLSQLRSTVRSLKDKMNAVETRLQNTSAPATYHSHLSVSDDGESDIEDSDLELSDLSVDLEELNLKPSSYSKRLTTKTVTACKKSTPADVDLLSDDYDNESLNSIDFEKSDNSDIDAYVNDSQGF